MHEVSSFLLNSTLIIYIALKIRKGEVDKLPQNELKGIENCLNFARHTFLSIECWNSISKSRPSTENEQTSIEVLQLEHSI